MLQKAFTEDIFDNEQRGHPFLSWGVDTGSKG